MRCEVFFLLKTLSFSCIISAVICMLSLQHPYISVSFDGHGSYGGGQQFSHDRMMKRCGCGVVAATDLLLYLNRYHHGTEIPPFRDLPREGPLPFPAYDACLQRMRKSYFPMIPYAGINGLMLAAGMQLFFRRWKLPYTAKWCFGHTRLWDRIEAMLRADLPVIMSVGPKLPLFWRRERANFYSRLPSGELRATAGAHAHYFTVTGMDEDWLRISSWGRLYYLRRQEFNDYVARHSAAFVSNILYIERKT